jgi:uncharacterized protein (TIGR02453 family)
MLQPSTITFIQNIIENNNKPWFDKNKQAYTAAKEDFETVVTSILAGLSEIEPLFKEQKAKDCIYRIFRDVRFSKDKTPYKGHFGAYFSTGGRKSPGAGYYLHVEPGGKSFVGGGLWAPEGPLLKAVRQEIDYNFSEFTKIVEDKKFIKTFGKINGEQLKTLPQGYAADNSAIEYLKFKSFTAGHNLPDTELTSKKYIKTVLDVFSTIHPLIMFLNRSLS